MQICLKKLLFAPTKTISLLSLLAKMKYPAVIFALAGINLIVALSISMLDASKFVDKKSNVTSFMKNLIFNPLVFSFFKILWKVTQFTHIYYTKNCKYNG